MTLFVRAYDTASATVNYEWDGIDPCPEQIAGCEPCETFDWCKDPETSPVCDGRLIQDIYCLTEPFATVWKNE